MNKKIAFEKIKKFLFKALEITLYRAGQFLELLESMLSGLVDLISETDHSLNASFDNESSILSKRNQGFCLTPQRISQSLSAQGVLINGNTGSGKSTVSVIPSILSTIGSQLIFDTSGELHEKTSGSLHSDGVAINQINWNDPYQTQFFNPLLRCTSLSQKTKLATQLVSQHIKEGQKDYWSSSAIGALVSVMRIVCQLPDECRNLFQVSHVLDLISSEESRKQVNKLVAILEEEDKGLYDKYMSLIESGESLGGVLASAKNAVQMFALDESLALITSHDTLGDLMNMRKERTALYVHSSTTSADYYANMSNIFFNQFFEAFFDKLPTKDEPHSISFHLDEFPVLRLDNIDIICSVCRKYKGQMMIVCQDAENQITANYGKAKAQAILSNLRTKLFLSTSLSMATKLEQEIGKYEYEDKKTGHKRIRSLLTKDQIMQLPEDQGLITISGKKPILARLRPYYKTLKLRKRTELGSVSGGADIDINQDLMPKRLNVADYIKSWKADNGLNELQPKKE